MAYIKTYLYVFITIIILGCGGGEGTGSGTFTSPSGYSLFWSSSANVKGSINKTEVESANNIKNIHALSSRITTTIVDSAGNIYWSDVTNGAIYKSDEDGNNIKELISSLVHPLGLALDEDNNRLYYCDWIQNPARGEVYYCDLDGKNEQVFINSGLVSGGQLLFDKASNSLYISDVFGSKIMKKELSTINLEFVVSSSRPEQMVIDSINKTLMWADMQDDKIWNVRLDGTNKSVLIDFADNLANPRTLALDIDNNKLLFVIKNELQRSDLDGNNLEVLSDKFEQEVQSLWILQ